MNFRSVLAIYCLDDLQWYTPSQVAATMVDRHRNEAAGREYRRRRNALSKFSIHHGIRDTYDNRDDEGRKLGTYHAWSGASWKEALADKDYLKALLFFQLLHVLALRRGAMAVEKCPTEPETQAESPDVIAVEPEDGLVSPPVEPTSPGACETGSVEPTSPGVCETGSASPVRDALVAMEDVAPAVVEDRLVVGDDDIAAPVPDRQRIPPVTPLDEIVASRSRGPRGFHRRSRLVLLAACALIALFGPWLSMRDALRPSPASVADYVRRDRHERPRIWHTMVLHHDTRLILCPNPIEDEREATTSQLAMLKESAAGSATVTPSTPDPILSRRPAAPFVNKVPLPTYPAGY
ncbi:hypothetical protein [Sulfidibacter corallicola]|uniref:Uncharacterized protein n=1 Tax=Sulfidibacter corallicola TaxID=2818388 RepID=A0A8A4TQ64_SULCO|nr:hypothetical protein [Sulfidibacter corallicola]QTD51567.1 hypothetical protein J3U87_03780 [Sulfidibacter corallicola]